MAARIAEFVMMRYYFPDMKDRKRQAYFKQLFMSDMCYNLSNGIVEQITQKCSNRKYLVKITK